MSSAAPSRCRRRSQGRFSPGFCPTSPPGDPDHHPQGRDPNPIIGQETFINAAAVTAASLDATSPGARTSANLPVGTITGYSASSNDTVTAAGAAVTKTASPTSVIVGGDTTYTVTAAVPANTSFPNLVGVDTLPDGMTFDAYGAISCLNADSTLCAVTTWARRSRPDEGSQRHHRAGVVHRQPGAEHPGPHHHHHLHGLPG